MIAAVKYDKYTEYRFKARSMFNEGFSFRTVSIERFTEFIIAFKVCRVVFIEYQWLLLFSCFKSEIVL